MERFEQNLLPVAVPMVSVDGLLLDSNVVVLLMKIDVEGSERDVIGSAKQLIDQGRVLNILVEIGSSMWSTRGVTQEQMLQMLQDLSQRYDIRCINFGSLSTKPPMTLEQLKTTVDTNSGLLSTECWLRLMDHGVTNIL